MADQRPTCGWELSCSADLSTDLKDAISNGFGYISVPFQVSTEEIGQQPNGQLESETQRCPSGLLDHPDLVLSSKEWTTQILGKLSSGHDIHHSCSGPEGISYDQVLRRELNYARHLSLPAVMVKLVEENNVTVAQALVNALNHGFSSTIYVLVGYTDSQSNGGSKCATSDPWVRWNKLRTLVGYNKKVCLALDISHCGQLAKAELDRWLGEPLKVIMINTKAFLKNAKGYPVLRKALQDSACQLFKTTPGIIISGKSLHKDMVNYVQYMNYLWSNRVLPAVDDLSVGYEDYLQNPLQPLMNDLESSVYEIFEKDPFKYSQYQKAIGQCLLDKVKDEEKVSRTLVVMVVGAGRGPLVTACLNAAKESHRRIKLYALDKNENTIPTLKYLNKTRWNEQVTVISNDMRTWDAPEKADLIVSELLGSFGDNELSPECLDGAQRFLQEDGVIIPKFYCNYLAPISSPKLYSDLLLLQESNKKTENLFQTHYVVKLQNFTQLAPPAACFSFHHPKRMLDANTRFVSLEFVAESSCMLHGFSGYFESDLYGGYMMSILPSTYSEGMVSWFPSFFPIETPIPVCSGDIIRMHILRMVSPTKVWYEWCVTDPACSVIHNSGATSSSIGL